MSRDRLSEALRRLPRHQADESFTGEVLRRLDEPPASRGAPMRWWLPAAGALAAVALALVVGLPRQLPEGEASPRESAPTVAEMEAQLRQLRSEHAELKRRLGELRELPVELSREQGPVIYIGGDDDLDLVLDLSREDSLFRPAGAPQPTGRIRPASARGRNSS